MKSNLLDRLSRRAQAEAPTLKPRNADDVRSAILGDIYTEELRHKDGVPVAKDRPVAARGDRQRSLRIFYATTNTDAPLERDAVSFRNPAKYHRICKSVSPLQL